MYTIFNQLKEKNICNKEILSGHFYVFPENIFIPIPTKSLPNFYSLSNSPQHITKFYYLCNFILKN